MIIHIVNPLTLQLAVLYSSTEARLTYFALVLSSAQTELCTGAAARSPAHPGPEQLLVPGKLLRLQHLRILINYLLDSEQQHELFQLLWHLLLVFAMRFGNTHKLLVVSKGLFALLTLDFVVAISALRISGSYLELDDEPESTRTNTTLGSAALPSSLLFYQPITKQDLPSLLHTQISTHCRCFFQISSHPPKAEKSNSAVRYSTTSV